ncbi:interleukin-15 isoform X2 [Tachyglossus aculeatus]|uniref:interleukin-15 isoform X2 n=1 Tax=Tachyglossus aculeatus TaxID=9261 RepID=UPI0018F2AD43|nr:interleukin-15 isoform X2 [Tachyglossus aculeatus]
MLVMSRAPRKSTGACSRSVGGRKTCLGSTCMPCYLCLILHSHFFILLNNKTGIHFFILGCISVCLPKTEGSSDNGTWQAVIEDLKLIKNMTKFIDIDAMLYTDKGQPNCKVTVMRCFLLELHVILHESNDKTLNRTVWNIIITANSTLSSKMSTKESGCKKCEEFEEKNFTEFLDDFMITVQSLNNPSNIT